MRTILFVDDEPNILEGLQRMLFPLQREWKMAFVPSGAKALEAMEAQRFDVIVSDMRMPGMDGAQLLATVKKRFPDTVRFVLTGQTDGETVYRTVGDAHQFLNKPCKPKLLKECVDKAFAIRDLLASDRLKSVIAQVGSLPPVPVVYKKLCEELRSPECSIANVGRIIETDPAIVAKILQLVNSAFFGLRHRVATPAQAVSLLGIQTIRSLVLMTGLFAPMEQAHFPKEFSLDDQWRHSAKVGAYADAICKCEGVSKELTGDAYTAGLLHDAGELILAMSCAEDYIRARETAKAEGLPAFQVERQILGTSHAEVGAYLLGIWGLPNPIVEAIAYHHQPGESPAGEISPLAIVHIADCIDRRENATALSMPPPDLDLAFLRGAGLDDHLLRLEEACKSVDARQEESV